MYNSWHQWRKANKLQKLLNKIAPLFDYVDEKDKEIEYLTNELKYYKKTVRSCEAKIKFYNSVPEIDMAITKALLNSNRKLLSFCEDEAPDISIKTDLAKNKHRKSLESKNLTEEDINRLLDDMNEKRANNL